MKMVWETHKILDENISVNPTAVRVPVLVGHAESIYIETEKEIDIELAKNCLNEFAGISVIDNVQEVDFPTSFEHGHGTDDVYVGRIRKGLSKNNSLNLWVVAVAAAALMVLLLVAVSTPWPSGSDGCVLRRLLFVADVLSHEYA